MEKQNIVFIATSIDGYIADKDGKIDWLHSVPNPDGIDMGYGELMNRIDALVIGRNTFETVCNFDMDWPYVKPVYVISNSLKTIPIGYKGKIELVTGNLKQVLNSIHQNGHSKLYIDGGKTIQSFLELDLIDEMIITKIPILLGDGIPLFDKSDKQLRFEAKETKLFLDSVVQTKFIRKQ